MEGGEMQGERQDEQQDRIYEELDQGAAAIDGGADLGRLQNVPVELAIEIGRTRMTIGDALALGLGSVVTVGRLAGDPVDLLVNGRVIARGEVVAIEEELGLRITEIAAPVVEAPPPPPESDEAGNPEPGNEGMNPEQEVMTA
jgi:flagellar motor switch protein FliN/FliY